MYSFIRKRRNNHGTKKKINASFKWNGSIDLMTPIDFPIHTCMIGDAYKP